MSHGGISVSNPQAPSARVPAKNTLSPWQHAAIFLTAGLLIVSHRPDAVLTPQFWAEDGALFFADAHNLGWWRVMFQPASGYLCTLERLAAAWAQAVPLSAAPLLLNLIAISLQIVPLNLFLSSRFANLGTIRDRLLLGFLYVALPNSFGVNANITNSLWPLALTAFLVIIASPANTVAWRVFDAAVVIFSTLTGPFAVMIWPLAASAWGWKRRNRWTSLLLLLFTAGAVLEGSVFLRTGNAGRVPGSLGASPLLFAKILATQVFFAALAGRNGLPYRRSYALHAVVIAIIGIAVYLYALWRGRWELKLLVIFAIVVLTAVLLNPMAPPPRWMALLTAWGERYWYIPMLAFVCSLVWITGRERPGAIRMMAVAALAVMTVGIVRDWRHPRFADLHFADYARQFSELPKGSTLTIPINPPGWSMTLVKQ